MAVLVAAPCSFALLHQGLEDRWRAPTSVSSNCDRLHLGAPNTRAFAVHDTSARDSRHSHRFRSLKAQSSANETTTSQTAASSGEASTNEGPPTIQLEFIPAKPPADGTSGVTEVTIGSGEKVLRNLMLDNKIELYALYGKVMNCGGGGSCGTCIVEILEGEELLSERTWAEDKYLKKKPSSWRLACQTIVGDKSNRGKVKVQQLPQTLKK